MKHLTIGSTKGVYAGERCFVVGNGPSLRDAPFDLLKDEYTFGMNLIGLVSDYTDWLPSFYVFTSMNFNNPDEQPMETVLKAIDGSLLSFVWDNFKYSSILKDRDNVVWIPVSHSRHYKPGDGDISWWSDDASKRVSKYGSTLFAALQIAAYMGFSPIYIIGADGYQGAHKISEPDCNHFHPRYHKTKDSAWPPMANAFGKHIQQIALTNCQRLGVEIYDATQSPGLGVLPKVDLMAVVTT